MPKKVKSAAVWSKGDFDISINALAKPESKKVSGHLSIYFGIHKDKGYVCTHLNTGMRVGKLGTLREAKLFCEELSRLGDWATIKKGKQGFADGNTDLMKKGAAVRNKYLNAEAEKRMKAR